MNRLPSDLEPTRSTSVATDAKGFSLRGTKHRAVITAGCVLLAGASLLSLQGCGGQAGAQDTPITAPATAIADQLAFAPAAPVGPLTTTPPPTTAAPAPPVTEAPPAAAAPTPVPAVEEQAAPVVEEAAAPAAEERQDPAPAAEPEVAPASATQEAANVTAPVAAGASSPAEAEFLARINGLRASLGMPDLTMETNLVTYAQGQAHAIAAAGQLFHSEISALLGAWSTAGENVGFGPSVQSVHDAFVNSPHHYDNLVNGAFTHIGIAVHVDGAGRIWTSHNFAG